MTPKEFQKQFKRLLMTRVEGMDWDDKLAHVRRYLRQLEARQSPEEESAELSPSVKIIPFEPGKRPVDEALYPGHGCSERVGYLCTSSEAPELADEVWILYRMRDLYAFLAPFDRAFQVTLSAWFLPPTAALSGEDAAGEPVDDSGGRVSAISMTGSALELCPVPGLIDVPLNPKVVSTAAYPVPLLEDSSWSAFHQTAFVASITPAKVLLPRAAATGRGFGAQGAEGDPEPRAITGYRWEDVAEAVRARTPDGADPFTFANMFRQAIRIDIKLSVDDGREISSASTDIEVFDTGRFGSLYARLLDRLVKADYEAQREQLQQSDLHIGHHPFYPVLTIGTDKAMLYMRAIHQDLDQHRRNLPDPRWLLRVGLYLELLTCLGIFEAVKGEYPDMLSPEERGAFEQSELFAPIRARLDVDAWRRVWELREIAPRGAGLFSAGPVSLANLMRKQKATLAFLHAHHEDLKGAIELAGKNLCNAQETWHRVFRDAERAVFKDSALAFPELAHLDPKNREFALWHQRGDMRRFGLSFMPEALTGLFGDQDGIFPSACRQYRKSMNDVAQWAAQKGLMDYTGDECIPKNASLLEAYMENNATLLTALQRRDGAALELDEPPPAAQVDALEEAEALLRKAPVFKPLMDREIHKLAQRARRATFGPLDRIVIQGQRDSSMFIVAYGAVEVLFRQPDGRDLPVATLEKGAVFGEFGILTGEERMATVRAIGEVVLYEISKEALQPVIEARPQLVIELSMMMATRQAALRDVTERLAGEERVKSLAGRIRRFLLG